MTVRHKQVVRLLLLLSSTLASVIKRQVSCQTAAPGNSSTAPLVNAENDNAAVLLLDAATLCAPETISSQSHRHCVEVAHAEQLWDALADPVIQDIHITQSIDINTTALFESRGMVIINRTRSVRLLGRGPSVSLHFLRAEQPPDSSWYWMELRAWLCIENLHPVSGLLSAFEPVQLASKILSLSNTVGVRLPEVEQVQAWEDDFRAQGGYLTRSSGLVLVNSTLIASYGFGNFFPSNSLNHWLRIVRGVRRVLQLFPAWPIPAVMLPRGLVFTEGIFQAYRYVNVSIFYEGNWPATQEKSGSGKVSLVNENCQTLAGGINGKDYAGDISVAHDGSPCLPWASINLPGADFSGMEGSSSCRNPADHFGAWCFTASPYPLDLASMYVNEKFDHDLDTLLRQVNGGRFPYSWKYCDVRECKPSPFEDCQFEKDSGESYVGDVKTSRNGKPCQLWNQTSLYDFGRPHSFCRNPSGFVQSNMRTNGVWCWTDVQRGEWDLCDVRTCNDDDLKNMFGDLKKKMLEESEPESKSSTTTNYRDVIILSSIAAVVLQAVAVVACVVYRLRSTQRMSVYDVLEKARLFIQRPQNSVTSVVHAYDNDGGVDQQRAISCSSDADSTVVERVLSVSASSVDNYQHSAQVDSAFLHTSLEDLPLPRKMASILNASPVELGYVQLESQLGVGTFGKVWGCKWRPGGDSVHLAACKIVDMKGLQSKLREQLSDSVEAVYMKNGMVHPHVVRTLQVYKVLARADASLFGPGYSRPDDGMELWIIQELCDMGDLASFCKETWEGQYYRTILEILWEVMSALYFLHERGVVHADLKLENVLLQRSSSTAKGFICKVGDFGVSHIMMGRDYYYSSSMSGEIRVLAPEVLRSNKISIKMDTFSFGILMHDLYCRPTLGYQRDSFPVVCTKTLTGERPIFPSHTPEAYKALAEACWTDDPGERPTDADVLQSLQLMSRDA